MVIFSLELGICRGAEVLRAYVLSSDVRDCESKGVSIVTLYISCYFHGYILVQIVWWANNEKHRKIYAFNR